jgi:hypothetical protein
VSGGTQDRLDLVLECSYDTPKPSDSVLFNIAYANCFDEKKTGRYAPYLHDDDTAANYGEGQIDWRGPGFNQNLRDQFAARKKQGFHYIELDNCDAYPLQVVLSAYSLALSEFGLLVIAKNPGLLPHPEMIVRHPAVTGIIVEKFAGTPASMDAVRMLAGKPNLWTQFVFFGRGWTRARTIAQQAKKFKNVGVTYSALGEYESSRDVQVPLL